MAAKRRSSRGKRSTTKAAANKAAPAPAAQAESSASSAGASDEQLAALVTASKKRMLSLFAPNQKDAVPHDAESEALMVSCKVRAEYAATKDRAPPVPPAASNRGKAAVASGAEIQKHAERRVESLQAVGEDAAASVRVLDTHQFPAAGGVALGDHTAVVAGGGDGAVRATVGRERKRMAITAGGVMEAAKASAIPSRYRAPQSSALIVREERRPKPVWHAPWKMMRVISGHLGWVRCIAVDPANEWFVTGAGDRTIKIWDMASGRLKLTLTGHISTVRGLVVSDRHPYLFSVGEDKTVRCWDLEQNKIVRHFHGHLSGVYTVGIHPTVDVLATGGRDCTVRVWDIRSQKQAHVLTGHKHTVMSVVTQSHEPQLVSGAMDNTVRTWDLIAGKCRSVLTNHKKSVRAVVAHEREYAFASVSADNIKVWKCPDGNFMRNISGHNTIVNAMALNADNVLTTGGDNGTIKMWDWSSGYNFQTIKTTVQAGSLESEAGIYSMAFDKTGSRLITGEADKTIKMWREDADATPESHPIDADWDADVKQKKY